MTRHLRDKSLLTMKWVHDPQTVKPLELTALGGSATVMWKQELFEKQHICNKCCSWPAFGLQIFGDLEVDTDSDEA